MKKQLLTICALLGAGFMANAQIQFDPTIETNYITDEVQVPGNPLQNASPVYRRNRHGTNDCHVWKFCRRAGTAKEWHDFIGFHAQILQTNLLDGFQ